MLQKYKIIRIIVYIVEIILFFIIQENITLIPKIFQVTPIIIMPIAIVITIFEGQAIGMCFGFFTGLLMDIGYGGIIGFNVIILGLICFLIDYLYRNFIRINILTSLITLFLSIFFIVFFRFLFFYVFKGYEFSSEAFIKYYVPIMIYTFCISPIIYYINKTIFTILNKKQII